MDEAAGSTPLSEEESEGLLPDHISTREELNAWEATNIEEADVWGFERKRQDVLTAEFIRLLHRKMFDTTWAWAGEFRRSDKNIGVPKYAIPSELQKLCGDVSYWIEHEVFPLTEIAARYHHRLVLIHPFPNGNGRHARLSADLLLHNRGAGRLQWKAENLQDETPFRLEYIRALQAADQHNLEPLLTYLGLA